MKNFFKKLMSSKSQSKYFSETVQRVGKNNAGFSLVELIVVIAIMAILAAVAVIGVSIYIPKAQEAADKELMNVLGDALRTACLSEGVDPSTITATIAVDAEGKLAAKADGTVNLVISGTSKQDKLLEIFNQVYTEKNAVMKQPKDNQLKFDGKTFVWSNGNSTNSVYDGITFDPDDIKAIKDSNFNKLGAGVLLDRVDLATGLLAGLAGDGNARVEALLTDPSNLAALAELMDWEEDEIDAQFDLLVQKKVDLMIKQDPSLKETDLDELYGIAAKEILSNNAVLIAATQPKYNQDEFVVAMAEGTAKSIIIENLSKDTSTAISQAALVYGMYTSYAALNNIEVSDDFNMKVVLDAMENDDFKSYMANEAQKDLDAYNASMNMINTSTSNKAAVEDVLLNGFDSEGLNNMMSDALK